MAAIPTPTAPNDEGDTGDGGRLAEDDAGHRSTAPSMWILNTSVASTAGGSCGCSAITRVLKADMRPFSHGDRVIFAYRS
jgi:hypothetical protein